MTAFLGGGGGPLQGTLTATLAGGVATFTNLYDDTAETITLEFTGGGLTSLASVPVVVSPAAASQLVVSQPPSSTATAGAALPTQPVLLEKDRFGNIETGDSTTTVTASLASGTGPLQGTTSIVLKDGVATFTNLYDNAAETITLSFSGAGLKAGPTGSIVVSPAAAAKLVIQSQPSQTATAGTAFKDQPVIDEEDQYGNILTGDSTTTVTAQVASGTGTLAGGTSATVKAGVATFSTLADDTAGTITLAFTGAGLTSPASVSIVVSPASASQLVVHTSASGSSGAGQAFSTQPVLYEEDQYGNLVTGDNTTVVTAQLSGGGQLGGAASVAVQGGIATFTDLAAKTAGDAPLAFSAAGLSSASTGAIVVSPAVVYQLVIHTEPSATATVGQAFPTQPVIYEEDQYGNIETGDSTTMVTATLASGPGPLLGTATVTLAGGVAAFTNLSDNTVGTIALAFAGNGLTSSASAAVAVTTTPPAKLVIHAEPPSTAAAGQSFATAAQPVVVYEEDQYGDIETTDSSTTVTATLASGAGTLQGTTTVTLADGVATFTNLYDNTAGMITMAFSGGGLTSPATGSITVSPAVASQWVIHTQPSTTATAGQALAVQPVIYEEDQYGNLETGDNSSAITASLASGTGPLQGTTSITVKGGVAAFTNLYDNTAGAITLAFSGGGLTSPATGSITVSPAAATQLVIHTQPSTTALAGEAFAPQPVIYEEDQFGNVETGDNSTVVATALASGSGPLQGTESVTVKDGVATFNDLADSVAETIALDFSGGGLHSMSSNSIQVATNGPRINPASAPTITGEMVVMSQKKNKKGKPVGKPVLQGFTLDFSTAMNAATAGSAANYRMTATSTKHAKKKTIPPPTPVAFTAAYNAATNSVMLTLAGKQAFAKGGQITVSYSAVTSASGDSLDSSDATFTIQPKGTGIALG